MDSFFQMLGRGSAFTLAAILSGLFVLDKLGTEEFTAGEKIWFLVMIYFCAWYGWRKS